MEAGRSASTQARDTGRAAAQHRRAADELTHPARRYAAGAAGERRIAGRLGELDTSWRVLADRRWPGSPRAQVDFVVAGPGGVFIIDAKNWREVMLHGDRLFRGDADVTEDFSGLASLVDLASDALVETGLVPHEVGAVAVILGLPSLPPGGAHVAGVDVVGMPDLLDHLTRRGRRIPGGALPEIVQILEETFPPYFDDQVGDGAEDSCDAENPGRARDLDSPASGTPMVPGQAPRRSSTPAAPHPALFTVEQLDELAVRSARAEPVESWMTFLHPRQLRATMRHYSGPSRVRGAAGTGKTVVGLHRAVHLARETRRKVLVTAYVRTLPAVLGGLLTRLSPETSHLVDCRSVHQAAVAVLARAGVANKLNEANYRQAFSLAWMRTRVPSGLADIDPSPGYWQDEIAYVIKGRGITTLEEYLETDRVGRRRGLDRSQREAVWMLRDEYEAELRRRDSWDWADVMTAAIPAAASLPQEYAAVVVDEAQDLSCQMVRFLHTLAGDGPNAFSIIGDGQQTIYPGGYTLKEAGVNVVGRAIVLEENYRNTSEILEAARSLTTGDRFVDIDGVDVVGDPATAQRHGPKPLIVRRSSEQQVDDAIVARVAALIGSGHRQGDIAVLALHTAEVRRISARLRSSGIPTILIEDYTGVAVEAVKVGTVKRAKGLEFSQVVVAHAPARLVDGREHTPQERFADARVLQRRELYVAMTRARDGLWVGVRDDAIA